MPFLTNPALKWDPQDENLVATLQQKLIYNDSLGRTFTIPAGFKCDLASVPRLLRSFSTPWHQSARSGIWHDCAYRWFEEWGLTRSECDGIYRESLRESGVGRIRSRLQWSGVRVGGWWSWSRWRDMDARLKGVRPPVFDKPSLT